jgi:putative oxidoreductase
MENNMQNMSTSQASKCTCCHKSGCSCGIDIAMLLLRLVLALVFIMAGYKKVTGLEMTVGFFGKMGIPAIFAYLVAFGELASGIAMLLGVWTKYFGYIIGLIMLGAIYFVHWKNGFGNPGGPEYTMALFAMALAVSFAGPGKYAVLKSHCGDMCTDKCETKHQ